MHFLNYHKRRIREMDSTVWVYCVECVYGGDGGVSKVQWYATFGVFGLKIQWKPMLQKQLSLEGLALNDELELSPTTGVLQTVGGWRKIHIYAFFSVGATINIITTSYKVLDHGWWHLFNPGRDGHSLRALCETIFQVKCFWEVWIHNLRICILMAFKKYYLE